MASPTKKLTSRYIAILIIAVVLFVVFFLRLLQYQIIDGAALRIAADQSLAESIQVTAARGDILDRYGRPLATSRMGYSVIIQKGNFPSSKDKVRRNAVILQLCGLLNELQEERIDHLPLSDDVTDMQFKENMDSAIRSLRKKLGLQTYATAQNCFDALVKRYALEEIPAADARLIMSVRYEMELGSYETYLPITIASDVSMNTVATIKEQADALPGVDIDSVPVRVYNYPSLASHILGYTGPIYAEEYDELKEKGYQLNDTIGKDGIEKAMETYLKGTDGTKAKGSTPDQLIALSQKEVIPGDNVVLSLDVNLQLITQTQLEQTIKTIQKKGAGKTNQGGDATAGAVVVVKVNTGEVLAAATYPTYSITDLLEDYDSILNAADKPLYNRAFLGTYPPGSAFKPIVGIAALNEGIITEDTTIVCKHDYTFYKDYQPHCLGWHGATNLRRALAVSCNYYFFEVGRQLGIEKIDEYATELGMGEKTGIELAESAGTLAGPASRALMQSDNVWHPGDTLQASIGQSDHLFTPLQLAMYTATVANEGTRYRARLVKTVVSKDHSETKVADVPEILNTVDASKAAFDAVKAGMKSVTQDGGTGAGTFADYVISVGGKTGSAEVFKGSPNAVFIAFAPYDNPEIAVAIVVEHGWHGGSTAGIARAIFNAYFLADSTVYAPQNGILLQ